MESCADCYLLLSDQLSTVAGVVRLPAVQLSPCDLKWEHVKHRLPFRSAQHSGRCDVLDMKVRTCQAWLPFRSTQHSGSCNMYLQPMTQPLLCGRGQRWVSTLKHILRSTNWYEKARNRKLWYALYARWWICFIYQASETREERCLFGPKKYCKVPLPHVQGTGNQGSHAGLKRVLIMTAIGLVSTKLQWRSFATKQNP